MTAWTLPPLALFPPGDPPADSLFAEVVTAMRASLRAAGLPCDTTAAHRAARDYFTRELGRLLAERRTLEIEAYGEVSVPTSVTIA